MLAPEGRPFAQALPIRDARTARTVQATAARDPANRRPSCGEISNLWMEASLPKRSSDLRIPEVSASLPVCRLISLRRAGSETGEHLAMDSEKDSGIMDSGLNASGRRHGALSNVAGIVDVDP